jgi:ATP-dependent helicase/nuclease subunit A
MTLKEAIRQLESRVLDVKEEGESVLAEENLDAVRLMSIHKAKGLEFPIVVLAGCHSGTEARQSGEPNALFDWSTGLTGLRIGAMTDLAGLFITEKTRLRNIEEQKRLLYVAMTRAREHLIVSYAESGRPSSGSFISMIDDTLDGAVTGAEKSMTVSLGNSAVEIEIVSENLTAPGRAKDQLKRAKKKPDWQPYIDLWARRAALFEKAQQTPPFLTPTLLKRQEQTTTESGAGADGRGARQTLALVIGDLAHRFLQNWRFTADANGFEAEVRDFIGAALPREFHSNRREIEADLREIFRCFFASKVYRELATATILGREVPLLMPWNGQIMEGVIDLLYEKNGLLYLADYKTDRIDRRELAPSAAQYRRQAEIYMTAARQCLRRDVTAFKLIFLRLGEAVELTGEKNSEPMLF